MVTQTMTIEILYSKSSSLRIVGGDEKISYHLTSPLRHNAQETSITFTDVLKIPLRDFSLRLGITVRHSKPFVQVIKKFCKKGLGQLETTIPRKDRRIATSK